MIHSLEFVFEKKSSNFVNYQVPESKMPEFGRQLGRVTHQGSVVFLNGTLGMGKTTLSRSVIESLGWSGRVKSPTYTLVEPYELPNTVVYHFDLYRLSDPEELEFMGIRDMVSELSLWLVEWPEKGMGILPNADIEVVIAEGDSPKARQIELIGHTEKGHQQIDQFRFEGDLIS